MENAETAHHTRFVRRNTTALGLGALVAIHVLDLPGKWEETPYLAYGYIGLILFSIFLMERILRHATKIDFLAAAGLSAAVIAAFVVNRTVGMPGATGDVGNWFEPLGLLSLVVEVWIVTQAMIGYRAVQRVDAADAAKAAQAADAVKEVGAVDGAQRVSPISVVKVP